MAKKVIIFLLKKTMEQLNNKINEQFTETCVSCGLDTKVNVKLPIYLRDFYIEGAGQLCEKCWRTIYENKKTN